MRPQPDDSERSGRNHITISSNCTVPAINGERSNIEDYQRQYQRNAGKDAATPLWLRRKAPSQGNTIVPTTGRRLLMSDTESS
jgi:hypothetical protein